MFALDNRTLLVSQLIVAIVITAFSFIPSRRYKIRELRSYKYANLSYLTGFGLLLFQQFIPKFVSVLISNTLILLNFILFYHIVLNLFKIKFNKKISLAVLVLNGVCFVIFLYFIPSTYNRILTISINIIILQVASIIKYLSIHERKVIGKTFVLTQSFYIAMLVFRIVITSFRHLNIDSIFNTDIGTSIIFISTIIYHISINLIIFIQLLNRSVSKLRDKVDLIKSTHNDMQELNSLLGNENKYTLNAQLYDKINWFIVNRFKIESIIIYKANWHDEKLKMVSFLNIKDYILEGVSEIPITISTISGKAVITKQPQFVKVDEYPDNQFKNFLLKEGYVELVSYPIISQKGVIGAFTLGITNRENLINEDSYFFTLICNQIGTILENASLYEELDNLATTDSLTSISNRRNFLLWYLNAFKKAKRGNKKLSILMIDIDHFKSVNDTFGHEAGDMVLIQTVNMIKSNLRDTDFLARYGGEEFILLLEDLDIDAAYRAAERIRNSIMNYDYDISTTRLKVTISLGITELSQTDNDPQDVINRADAALYRAKNSGRNRSVKIYP